MGFLDYLIKKINTKGEHLLQWQNTIMKDSPNRLIMTEQQLKTATIQQAENDLRIINDCHKLLQSTKNPDVFFMRLNLLVEKSKHLCTLEKYVPLSGASPTAAYNEVVTNYHAAIQQFLIQYLSDTFDKAESMKTEKARIGKYQKFYDSLQEYYCYMNDENKNYIETKYRVYTENKRG